MLDRDILRSLEPELEAAVRNAVLTLANSGVLDLQMKLGFESIASGATDEAATDLAARILKYRQENHGLIALKALAEEFKEESRNA